MIIEAVDNSEDDAVMIAMDLVQGSLSVAPSQTAAGGRSNQSAAVRSAEENGRESKYKGKADEANRMVVEARRKAQEAARAAGTASPATGTSPVGQWATPGQLCTFRDDHTFRCDVTPHGQTLPLLTLTGRWTDDGQMNGTNSGGRSFTYRFRRTAAGLEIVENGITLDFRPTSY